VKETSIKRALLWYDVIQRSNGIKLAILRRLCSWGHHLTYFLSRKEKENRLMASHFAFLCLCFLFPPPNPFQLSNQYTIFHEEMAPILRWWMSAQRHNFQFPNTCKKTWRSLELVRRNYGKSSWKNVLLLLSTIFAGHEITKWRSYKNFVYWRSLHAIFFVWNHALYVREFWFSQGRCWSFKSSWVLQRVDEIGRNVMSPFAGWRTDIKTKT